MMSKLLQNACRVAGLTSLFLFAVYFRALSQIKPTPSGDRIKTIQQRKLLENKSMVKDIKFRNIGPTIMGGRGVDLDVNPEDPTEFYIAYASGGLWYTVNNGQSFVPVFDTEDTPRRPRPRGGRADPSPARPGRHRS